MPRGPQESGSILEERGGSLPVRRHDVVGEASAERTETVRGPGPEERWEGPAEASRGQIKGGGHTWRSAAMRHLWEKRTWR